MGTDSANYEKTRQWAGREKQQAHLKAQEQDRRSRKRLPAAKQSGRERRV